MIVADVNSRSVIVAVQLLFGQPACAAVGCGDGLDVVGDVGFSSDDNALTRNALSANAADGIFVGAETGGTLVLANDADENGDDGIDVRSPATTITRNSADRNVDLGIEAVVGVIDGGGNRASGNGNPLQCVNVVCS